MNQINVLYILGNGSLYGNNELRFSLRSLDKFGKNVGRVFITGDCPDFVDKEKITFLPELDIGKPMINHWWKVDQTFRKTDIGDRALLMYDDIFFCKPVNLAKYPWRWKELLPPDRQDGEYRQCLYNATRWLQAHNCPCLNYENHIPCIYEKEKFLSMESDYNELKLYDSPMAVRSVYANRFGIDGEHQEDLKIMATVANLEKLIVDRDCFSIASDCYEGPVEEWLKKTFPERSRWEK